MKGIKKQYLPLIAVLVAIGLAGCGSDKQAATQVAVKVGDEEISVHQINHALAKLGGIDPARAKDASREILERLIDQQVLIQKAIETKVDRDPQVVQNIEAARRQILSQAYMEKATATAGNVTAEERAAFYKKHPELFAERRIYRFQELVFSPSEEVAKELQGELAKVKTLNDVAAWLRSKNTPFTAGSSVKSAEQLPFDLAPKFHQMRDGQMTILPAQGSMVLLQLAASQQAPIAEKEAQQAIDQYLVSQKRQEFALAEVKKLRDAAKIEYQGEFGKVAKEAGDAAKSAAAAAPSAAGTEKTADGAAKAPAADAISKGLSSLK